MLKYSAGHSKYHMKIYRDKTKMYTNMLLYYSRYVFQLLFFSLQENPRKVCMMLWLVVVSFMLYLSILEYYYVNRVRSVLLLR